METNSVTTAVSKDFRLGYFKGFDAGYDRTSENVPAMSPIKEEGDMYIISDNGEEYVKLPTDANGVAYRIGDEVWSTDPETLYSAKILDMTIVGELTIEWEDGAIDHVDYLDMTHTRPLTRESLIEEAEEIVRNREDYDDPLLMIVDVVERAISLGGAA